MEKCNQLIPLPFKGLQILKYFSAQRHKASVTKQYNLVLAKVQCYSSLGSEKVTAGLAKSGSLPPGL